jgi:hypothetical protein
VVFAPSTVKKIPAKRLFAPEMRIFAITTVFEGARPGMKIIVELS